MTAPFNIFEAPFPGVRDWTRTTDKELNYNAVESTQRFIPGQRLITHDGRVYKYGYGKEAVIGGRGVGNKFPANKHIAYAALPSAVTAGSTAISVTFPSTAGYANVGFAKDELAGGFIVLGHGGATNVQQRMIVGNDAMGATGSTANITIAQPTVAALTTSEGAEVYPNPYAYLGGGGTTALQYNGWMGVAPNNVATSLWQWIQTWGPCWVCPGGSTSSNYGKAAQDRMAYFVGDGTVNDYTTAAAAIDGYQYAGFMIDTTSAAVAGMPLIMLQISI
jgi:hypothetical protein